MSILYSPPVAAVINREHAAAKIQSEIREKQRQLAGASHGSADFRSSELHKTHYLSVGPKQGRFLYSVTRASRAKNIVEFGTSYGISTLYLAAAAAENQGHVIGSEYHPEKARKARQNLKDAGLDSLAVIKVGDARETLSDLTGEIDLLFLDGDKTLYLPMVKMLEERFHPGTLVIADNMERDAEITRDFAEYIGRTDGNFVTSMFRFKRSRFSFSIVIN